MLKRIRILVLLQLSNYSKKLQKGSKRKYIAVALRAMLILLATILATIVLRFLKTGLSLPINSYFLIFIIIVTQVINIITVAAYLLDDLYKSKDNQILFSLAVKNDEVFLSKVVIFYIKDFIKNLYIILPIMISFGILTTFNHPVIYFASMPFLIILMPLLTLSIGAVITIPIVYIKIFIHRFQWASLIIVLFVMAMLFLGSFKILNSITLPIRIIQVYHGFVSGLSLLMVNIASYGAFYTSMVQIMYGVFVLKNIIIVILSTVLLGAFSYILFKPLFFYLTSKSSELAVKKQSHKTKGNMPNLYATFLNKEINIAKRSMNEFLQKFIFLMIYSLISFIINFIYTGFDLSFVGYKIMAIFNLIIGMLFVFSTASQAATLITTEGKEFSLLKTAPSNTSLIVWAKLTVFFVVSTLLIIAAQLFTYFLIDLYTFSLFINMTIVLILVNVAFTFSALQTDIMYPKFSDYEQTGSLSHNENVSNTLSRGLGIAFLVVVIFTGLHFYTNNFAWVLLILFCLGYALYRTFTFRRVLRAYFNDIEY